MGFLIWNGEHFRRGCGQEVLSDWGGTERARCRGERGKFPPTVSGREIRGREFPSGLVFSVGTRWPPDLVDVVPGDEGIRASGE